MPLTGTVLKPNDTGAQVGELHTELSELGMVIMTDEQTTQKFGDSTTAAVRAFRQKHGLPKGDTVDPSAGRLMHTASAFASGGRADLRTAVHEAATTADTNQPQEIYWLARYATIAGDYQTAHDLAVQAPDHQGIKDIVLPILNLTDKVAHPLPHDPPVAQPLRPPEVPYPENFYTYRHNLYPLEDVLSNLQREVTKVGEPPRNPAQALPHLHARPATIYIQAAVDWLEAIKQWEIGNAALNRRRYAEAQAAYDACQSRACNYFSSYHEINLGSGSLIDRLRNLIEHLANNKMQWMPLWQKVVWRRELLSLEELKEWDWPQSPPNLFIPRDHDPVVAIGTVPPLPDYGLGFIQHYFQSESEESLRTMRQNDLEAALLIIACVLVPLARAEANRARRQYDAALRDLRFVLDPVVVDRPFPLPDAHVHLACEFIELPFARLLLAETMLDKADAEYKARIVAEPSPAPDAANFQNLKAAQTYLAIKEEFKDEGEYVARVDISQELLAQEIQQAIASNNAHSQQFQRLGKNILIPTLTSSSVTFPGLDRRAKVHEPLLIFELPEGEKAMRETNPRVYAVLLAAQAKLEQLKAGFNYLGYLDNYVPPWRFQFLLERARYFAEHAKNAQREYLNFLSNAEREEFQELSASQNVEMEKSNVRIETARVDQSLFEVQAAQKSSELAAIHAEHAQQSFDEYKEFDEQMDELFHLTEHNYAATSFFARATDILPGVGPVLDIGIDLFTGGASSRAKDAILGGAQRNLEKHNLERAAKEAEKSAEIASAQVTVAVKSLVVASLQRQAALLRHEFALQNLEFLRNRTLNAEQWFRLAFAIRDIGETYQKYAVELAFLAEQAYEFEADKPINVIRFDYDLSEIGDFLASDFLLRDLDTLEKDLIITQRQRQQHVRYVLSMAREFPEALQDIRDNGIITFSLRLEQLEKRFPGLYNIRIGAVDVLPIALMDSTRFSLELTHLGTSQVRLKAEPDTPPGVPSPSPLNTNDLPIPEGEWLAELQESWPVKFRVMGPETAVFSGLTRQEANAVFAFATAGQRQAFESLGAAAAWQIDFTARENQVVPGTLADLLITFTLSGYHDPELRFAVDHFKPRTAAVTRWLSGRTTFPDSLYEFNRSGRMTWNVSRDLLTLIDTLGAVRNVAVLLLPKSGQSNYFGRLMSHCEMQIRITSAGDLEVLNEIPQVTFTLGDAANPLRLTTQVALPPGAEISWEFGDNSARQSGASQDHNYAKPGRYAITLRVVRDGHLSEFQGDVVVTRSHTAHLRPPVTAFPTLERVTEAGIPPGLTRVRGMVNTPAADSVVVSWRVGKLETQKGDTATFDLDPGEYTLVFTAVRPLKARVYSRQRYLPDTGFVFNGLSLSSNRHFGLDGTEVTGVDDNPAATPFTDHLFPLDPTHNVRLALSPVDEWVVEFPLPANPLDPDDPWKSNACLRSVSVTDVEQHDFSEIQDAVLVLEYETTPGGS